MESSHISLCLVFRQVLSASGVMSTLLYESGDFGNRPQRRVSVLQLPSFSCPQPQQHFHMTGHIFLLGFSTWLHTKKGRGCSCCACQPSPSSCPLHPRWQVCCVHCADPALKRRTYIRGADLLHRDSSLPVPCCCGAYSRWKSALPAQDLLPLPVPTSSLPFFQGTVQPDTGPEVYHSLCPTGSNRSTMFTISPVL